MRISRKIQSFQANAPFLADKLETWYLAHQRNLPWRINRDPYRIWLSEVMLQQTTVQTVIPYFLKFLEKFPNVQTLAEADIGDVQENWSGLGYYSRARNLHKAAQMIALSGFPKTASELLELPGFGPYTSRAVASQAFGERVGVLDGNVIRVLSRMTGWAAAWWKPAERDQLQAAADALVKTGNPSHLNQGLMELGATVCTPQSPSCVLCPWNQSCTAFAKRLQSKLPAKKPRRDLELWIWRPQIWQKKDKVAMVENSYAPFLKNHLIFPGDVKKVSKKPRDFAFSHGITHHQIFVQLPKTPTSPKGKNLSWLGIAEMSRKAPSILLKKVLRAKNVLPLLLFIFFSWQGWAESFAPLPSTTELGTAITSGPSQLQDLSTDGTRVLYLALSKSQPQHQQLFEFLLPNWKEHRITYNDGEVTSAAWATEGNVLYVSNTDRRKEQPESWWGKASPIQENDIYFSDTTGLKIERLTKNSAQLSWLQRTSLKPPEWGALQMENNRWQLLRTGTAHGFQNMSPPKGLSPEQVLRWFHWSNPPLDWDLVTAKDGFRQIWWHAGRQAWQILNSNEPGVWIGIWPLTEVAGDHLVLRQNSQTQEYEIWRLHAAHLCAQKLLSTKIVLNQVMGSIEAKRLIFETQIKTDKQVWARSWKPEETAPAPDKESTCEGQTWNLLPLPGNAELH